MKANNTYNVVIANEACNFTATKYNTTLTGFAYEDAHNAAKEALRDIAGELGYDRYKVVYSSTLSAWMLINKHTQATIMTAKIEEVTDTTTDTMNTETKTMNETRRNELQAMADNAREWDIKTRGKAMKSDYAYMVLELMDTEEHANNYCSALREVLAAFPEVDRDELEIELDRFI